MELCETLAIDGSEISALYDNARKIQYLRDLEHAKGDQEAALADLKKKLSNLSKLEIVKKVPKQDRKETKQLLAKVGEMMSREGLKTQKELFVPDHLLCPIAGELMSDPALIQSGQTYEREIIERHFKFQSEKAERMKAEEDSDFDEERIFTCPITGQPVDRNTILPNKRIKLATEEFLRQNPWAYEFDPRVKYHKIPL